MAVQDWNATDDLNTTIEGVIVSEGAMTFPNINNLFRKMAAALKVFKNNAYAKDLNLYILPIASAFPTTPQEGDIWMQY